MKRIDSYIIEKLHLNKDIHLGDKYNAGDTCLMLSYHNFKDGNEPIITLDVMKILKIEESKLYYEFKTPFGHVINLEKPAEGVMNKTKGNYWFYNFSDVLCEMIIPHIEALDVIDEIENNNNKCKFFKKPGYIPDDISVDDDKEFKLMKSGKKLDFISFTNDDINTLKKAL